MLTGAGAILAGASLATSIGGFRSVDVALAPGLVGGVLLLLAQIAYVPNAVVWSICYTLGPGFAFGTGTVVAPTGSALGPLPMLPMLAALPAGAHSSVPGWVSLLMLSVPYLAGAFGGLLTARAAPYTGGRAGAAVGLRLRRGHRDAPWDCSRRSRAARWAAAG